MKTPLSDDQIKWAKKAYKASFDAGKTTADNYKDYIDAITQPGLDATVVAVVNSWKPIEGASMISRRQTLMDKLAALDVGSLAPVEAAVDTALAITVS